MAGKKPASNPSHLLSRIGSMLDDAEARWATIGALAVAFHGPIRASYDADALLSFKGSKTNLDAFADLLRGKGYEVEVREGEPGDPLGFVVRVHDSEGNQVDLIGGIRKLDSGFFERASGTSVDGIRLRISSAEDLIALKVFAGGPKVLEDAAGVIKVQGEKLDQALVMRLCKAFGAGSVKACERLFRIAS